MERLTRRNKDNEWVYIEKHEETIFDFDGNYVETRPYYTTDSGRHVDRLADYENLEEQGMLLKLNAPIDIIVRCAMCTNVMKSDRGCDGGCQVDEYLYEKIMKAILK